MRKIILGLVASAALATGILAAAPANAAGTGTSGHDTTMADAIPSLWSPATGFENGNTYWASSSADYSSNTTSNSQWASITTDSLTVFYGDYGNTWYSTFVVTDKVPVTVAPNRQPSTTVAVTNTTPYGTSTRTVTLPLGTDAPWTIEGGNVVLDPYSNVADAIYNAQYAMAYGGGQNAGFWFPAY
jgi:hypothetical protein